MIYLSGKWTQTLAQNHQIGMLCQPNNPVPPQDGIVWAADTGIYGKVPFSLDRYLTWLAKHTAHLDRNLFGTAPDVVGDWHGTLERSLPVIPAIKGLGYRVALVLQDGAREDEVPWDDIDAVFTGGSTEWKLSEPAYELAKTAQSRGIWTHMGRVNSLRRLRAAVTGGYDSADGTYVRFGPDTNSKDVLNWMTNLSIEPSMKI